MYFNMLQQGDAEAVITRHDFQSGEEELGPYGQEQVYQVAEAV